MTQKSFAKIASGIKSKLIKQFNYSNVHEVPVIKKVVLNMGVGRAVADSKVLNNALNDLTLISGQKAVPTTAKKSVASYKLREGMKIGCKVTLRRERMFEFLERLVYVALPRTKDFKGFSRKSFDGCGNLSFGVKEQIVFPEIEYDRIDSIRGLDITIVTSAKTSDEARALLLEYNLPFTN